MKSPGRITRFICWLFGHRWVFESHQVGFCDRCQTAYRLGKHGKVVGEIRNDLANSRREDRRAVARAIGSRYVRPKGPQTKRKAKFANGS